MRRTTVLALRPGDSITNPRVLWRTLIVLGLVLAGFVTHTWHHTEPSVIAMLGAGAAVLVSRLRHPVFLEDVEWETLVFFAGLFVMVGALVNEGIIGQLAKVVTDVIGDNYLVAAQAILIGSAVLSALVDNIPYVTTMSPLVYELVGPHRRATAAAAVAVVGVGLGCRPRRQRNRGRGQRECRRYRNRQTPGPSHRVLGLHQVRLVVASVTVLLCMPYLWLRYFVLA